MPRRPRIRNTLSLVLTKALRNVLPKEYTGVVRVSGPFLRINVASDKRKFTAAGSARNFDAMVRSGAKGYEIIDEPLLAKYLTEVVEGITGRKESTIQSPQSYGLITSPKHVRMPSESTASIREGEVPLGEITEEEIFEDPPAWEEEGAASSSRRKGKERAASPLPLTTTSPSPSPPPSPRGKKKSQAVILTPDSTVVIIDPEGKEVAPGDMPEVGDRALGRLLKFGYSAMLLSPAGAAAREAAKKTAETEKELGRQSVIAQILQASRSGDLKSSEVLEITEDLARGPLDPEKVKQIGVKVLQARRRALEEWRGRTTKAKSMSPRGLRQLLEKLFS